MDMRVVVLSSDAEFAALLRGQVRNLGCPCSWAFSLEVGARSLRQADAVVVDLAGGLDELVRLREELPLLQVLAVATDVDQAARARSAGAHHVIVEPFPIVDVIEALRALEPPAETTIVDLRAEEAGPVSTDQPSVTADLPAEPLLR
jgi:DNA-binding response OmpR family regulator